MAETLQEIGWTLTKWVTMPIIITAIIFYFVARKKK